MLNIDTSRLNKIDRIINQCKIIDLGSGNPPKFITVQVPGPDGARIRARWTGAPPGLAVDDYVDVQRRAVDGMYKVVGTDGATTSRVGYPFTVHTVDPTSSNADYSTIQDAIDAASAGDVILVGPGTYTQTAMLTIDKALSVIGLDRDRTIITSSTISITASIRASDVYLPNLTVTNTRDTGSATTALQVAGATAGEPANDVTIQNVVATCTNPHASGTATGLSHVANFDSATGLALINVFATGQSGTANNGYQATNIAQGADVHIYGGRFEGATADLDVDSPGVIELRGMPELANGLITGNGTVNGPWIDGSNSRVSIGASPPDLELHVADGDASTDPSSSFAQVGVESGGDSGIHLVNPDANIGRIMFGTPSRNIGGLIRWNYNSGNGLLEVATDLAGAAIRWLTGNFSEKMRLTPDGELGVGTTSPQSVIHAYSTASGWLVAEKTGVGGTEVIIVPNGSEDVTGALVGFYVISSDEPSGARGTLSIANGGTQDVTVGSDTIRFAVAASGQFGVKRLSGTHTHTAAVMVLYL